MKQVLYLLLVTGCVGSCLALDGGASAAASDDALGLELDKVFSKPKDFASKIRDRVSNIYSLVDQLEKANGDGNFGLAVKTAGQLCVAKKSIELCKYDHNIKSLSTPECLKMMQAPIEKQDLAQLLDLFAKVALACIGGDLDAVKTFIANDPSLLWRGIQLGGFTALDIALKHKQMPVVDFLVAEIIRYWRSGPGLSLLADQ